MLTPRRGRWPPKYPAVYKARCYGVAGPLTLSPTRVRPHSLPHRPPPNTPIRNTGSLSPSNPVYYGGVDVWGKAIGNPGEWEGRGGGEVRLSRVLTGANHTSWPWPRIRIYPLRARIPHPPRPALRRRRGGGEGGRRERHTREHGASTEASSVRSVRRHIPTRPGIDPNRGGYAPLGKSPASQDHPSGADLPGDPPRYTGSGFARVRPHASGNHSMLI